MTHSRKDFLKQSALLTGGVMLSNLFSNQLFAEDLSCKKVKKFGIQLYCLKDEMPKDPKGILQQLSNFGYRQIESYEGSEGMGMFWGMKPTEFKSYLESLNLEAVSSHCDWNKDFEKKAADAASAGLKYLICSWIGPQETEDGYKKFADEFNVKGEICRKNGIRFAYHNHDYSFKQFNGKYPQDILLKNTDPNLVDFQMDLYWVVTAGADPIKFIDENSSRFTLFHVKDRIKNSTEHDASCTLGKGSIEYDKIIKSIKKLNKKYLIVEQERYDGTTAIDAARENAAYLKALKF